MSLPTPTCLWFCLHFSDRQKRSLMKSVIGTINRIQKYFYFYKNLILHSTMLSCISGRENIQVKYVFLCPWKMHHSLNKSNIQIIYIRKNTVIKENLLNAIISKVMWDAMLLAKTTWVEQLLREDCKLNISCRQWQGFLISPDVCASNCNQSTSTRREG